MLNQYSLLPDDCILKFDRIDIWQYPLLADNPQAKLILSPDEQHRADRFYFHRHRRRYINAHSLLRLILARYVNAQAIELEFSIGEKGKPELINTSMLQFNLSHSEDMAILAIGQKYPLGIDLEYFSARPYFGIGKQLFSNEENQALRNAPSTLTPLIFFNLWVQKEAFIKASGLGLSYPTKQFNVPVLSQKPETIMDALHQRTWQMVTFMPEVGCCAALCHDEFVQEIRSISLSQQHLQTLL